MAERKLKMGMVGGGRDAFIGGVHRMAATLDGGVGFVAGALSSSPEKALASGRDLGLPDRRNYPSWEKMLEGEQALSPSDRIDFVTIVTPNHQHYPIAKAFAEAGFHVVLDKPMVHSSDQASDLIRTVGRSGAVFCVTYNYSGYPMVKHARELVRGGQLGTIRKVIVEYNQGWLAGNLERSGQKQADWRTDPARSGLGGAIGDIGSHAEQLVAYVTGLEIESLCADLSTFVAGRRLDDDANLLIRYTSGARGILVASQICVGCENDLRLRVWGDTGGLTWHQEDPNLLTVSPKDGPAHLHRRGNSYIDPAARAFTRLPAGHPEAFIEAFANIYRAAAAAMRAGGKGEHDYPTVHDGARGVHFIEQTVAASHSDRKWTPALWTPPDRVGAMAG